MLQLNKISPIWFCTAGLSVVFSATCGAASASSLIGDTINFQYFFPDKSSPLSSQRVITVAAGDSDEIRFFGFRFNPESSGFKISSSAVSWTSTPFNGFKLSSLDFDDGSSITGYNLTSNVRGLDDSRVAFAGNTFDLNWQGLRFERDTYINVEFKTSASNPTQAIPTPALLPGLIGMGVAALRKKGKEEEVAGQEA